jgi:hypothetical protein
MLFQLMTSFETESDERMLCTAYWQGRRNSVMAYFNVLFWNSDPKISGTLADIRAGYASNRIQKCFDLVAEVELTKKYIYIHTHKYIIHTHTHIQLYIYIYLLFLIGDQIIKRILPPKDNRRARNKKLQHSN